MISLSNLDSSTLIELIKDLLNKSKSLEIYKYEGNDPYKNFLWQGFGKSHGKKRVICDIKESNLSDFDLLNKGINDSDTLMNKWIVDEFILVIPKHLTTKKVSDLKSRINQRHKNKVQILDFSQIEELLKSFPEIEEKYRISILTWHEAYRHLAELLNNFYLKNRSGSARLLLKRANTKKFKIVHTWLSQAIDKYEAKGIDPIQIFASFNNSSSTENSRINRLEILLKLLRSEKKIVYSENFFKGCPTPVIAQIINSRKDIYQQQIWATFSNVISKGKKGITQSVFNRIVNWYGVDISSFTIFLFWIDSDNFLPLDQNTATLLSGFNVIDRVPNTFQEYNTLCKYRDSDGLFRSLVRDAYSLGDLEQDISRLVQSPKTFFFIQKFQSKEETESSILEIQQGFKIIAIRPREKGKDKTGEVIKQQHLKNLKHELYSFYHSYSFNEGKDSIVKYSEGIEEHLYSTDKMKISISATVGKNGSGKSSVSELLFLAINKFAELKIKNPKDELEDEEVYLDLYVKLDHLYKLSFGAEIEVFKYSFDKKNSQFHNPKKIPINKFNLEEFFYTIVVNYSHYGLNSGIIGSWINPLFHKNDSYQVPIVMNPKRTEGNIDVNIEEHLAKSRVLSNLLEPARIGLDKNLLPELLENKISKNLIIYLDQDKVSKNNKEIKKIGINEQEIDDKIQIIAKYHKIRTSIKTPFFKEVKDYLYCKLMKICRIYPKYIKYAEFSKTNQNFVQFIDFDKYIEELFMDDSHITFKIKQVLNYLKYKHIEFGKGGNSTIYEIGSLSDVIGKIQLNEFEKKTNKEKKVTKTIELIPPSIFKTEIEFENESKFSELSSGEKQKVFTINTIAYHLVNVNSVSRKTGLIKYKYVNVLFDEVELYFHPDMQRTFISDLLRYLEQITLNSISSINFNFITHSPFILSDIPNLNTLRIDDGYPLKYNFDKETFGANIYDLLVDNFFMTQGFIGELAIKKINETVEYINNSGYNSTKQKVALGISNLVSDEIISSKLLSLLKEKEEINNKKEDLSELEILKREKTRIEERINKINKG